MSMWLVNFLVHSSGTSMLPPGRILTEHANTSGMPKVVSGSSITVEPLDHIIFCVPSRFQTMSTKFMDVKSVPNMIGHVICLQMIKEVFLPNAIVKQSICLGAEVCTVL